MPTAQRYTQPALRERLKKKVTAGDKGGKPGQWSARKAQLLAAEYKKAGGGYREGGASEPQKHLMEWTDEEWQTRDGGKARRGAATARYLPKKAWDALSPAEQKATDLKKRAGTRKGKQFVKNTQKATSARKKASTRAPASASKRTASRTAPRKPARAAKAASPGTARKPRAPRKKAGVHAPARAPKRAASGRSPARKHRRAAPRKSRSAGR